MGYEIMWEVYSEFLIHTTEDLEGRKIQLKLIRSGQYSIPLFHSTDSRQLSHSSASQFVSVRDHVLKPQV